MVGGESVDLPLYPNPEDREVVPHEVVHLVLVHPDRGMMVAVIILVMIKAAAVEAVVRVVMVNLIMVTVEETVVLV